MNRGIIYAIGAYLIWGLLPLYWKALQHVSAVEILAHRIVWSFAFLVALVWIKKEWHQVSRLRSAPGTLGIIALTSVLLTSNWLLYIWAVNAGFIVETSLGYFINPLMNVLLGVFFLRERLRPLQWVPIGLAAAGVLYMTLSYGRPPWIALALAVSFAIYGLLKKRLPVGALPGLAVETAVVAPLAVVFLAVITLRDTAAVTNAGPLTAGLLVFSGVVTAMPLLLFNAGVQRINLSTIGILQYMAPTMQFLIGVLVYGEAFDQARVIGFGLIWTALLVYTLESLYTHRRAAGSSKTAGPSPVGVFRRR
jgi:chloramphenicol-sensitive protein RarD